MIHGVKLHYLSTSQYFKVYFIDYAFIVIPSFPSLSPSPWYPPLSCNAPLLSSCPWVLPISSLASPFLILFLTSPCLFCTYQLWFLIPVLIPPFSPFFLPTDNPPNDLHIYDSVPILVVCLVCFCFLGSVVDSCEFVIIIMFIVLVLFFLNKSL